MNSKIQSEKVTKFIDDLNKNRAELEQERIIKTEKEFACAHEVTTFRVKQLMGPSPHKRIKRDDIDIDIDLVNKMRVGSETEKPLSDMAIARILGTNNQRIIYVCGRRRDVLKGKSNIGRPCTYDTNYEEERNLNTVRWEQPVEGNEYWRNEGIIQENMGPHKSLKNFIGRYTMYPKRT